MNSLNLIFAPAVSQVSTGLRKEPNVPSALTKLTTAKNAQPATDAQNVKEATSQVTTKTNVKCTLKTAKRLLKTTFTTERNTFALNAEMAISLIKQLVCAKNVIWLFLVLDVLTSTIVLPAWLLIFLMKTKQDVDFLWRTVLTSPMSTPSNRDLLFAQHAEIITFGTEKAAKSVKM